MHYENTETKHKNGCKTVRKVSIRKGKGYKSVTQYRKGKKISCVRKPLTKQHIQLIKGGKFIPGLFSDCHAKRTRRRRK